MNKQANERTVSATASRFIPRHSFNPTIKLAGACSRATRLSIYDTKIRTIANGKYMHTQSSPEQYTSSSPNVSLHSALTTFLPPTTTGPLFTITLGHITLGLATKISHVIFIFIRNCAKLESVSLLQHDIKLVWPKNVFTSLTMHAACSLYL